MQMPTKAKSPFCPLFLSVLSLTLHSQHMHTLSHTPPQIPSTAGPITKGDWGQTLLSTPQIPDQVSCSTNTTSPLFLCLLIPRIRRHSWVMTEMISPSTTPPNTTPPTSLCIDLCLDQTSRRLSFVTALLASLLSLLDYLFPLSFWFHWCFGSGQPPTQRIVIENLRMIPGKPVCYTLYLK